MEGPFRPSLAVGNEVEVVVVDMVKLRRYLCSWVQEFEWIDDRLCEYHQHIPPSPMLSSIYLCSQTKEDKRTFGACIVTLSQGGGNMRMQISFPARFVTKPATIGWFQLSIKHKDNQLVSNSAWGREGLDFRSSRYHDLVSASQQKL